MFFLKQKPRTAFSYSRLFRRPASFINLKLPKSSSVKLSAYYKVSVTFEVSDTL